MILHVEQPQKFRSVFGGSLTRQSFSRLEWEMSPLRPGVEDFTKIPESLFIGPHARLGFRTREGIAVCQGITFWSSRLCPWCPRCHALTGWRQGDIVDNSNVDKTCSQWVSWPKIPQKAPHRAPCKAWLVGSWVEGFRSIKIGSSF